MTLPDQNGVLSSHGRGIAMDVAMHVYTAPAQARDMRGQCSGSEWDGYMALALDCPRALEGG